MKKIFKIAFVGAGYMASEHIKAFSGLSNIQIIGITSRTRAKADELASNYPGMQVFDDIEEMYQKTQADLVIVTVKELSMAEVAIECFRFPWAVLLEKPAGYDLENARMILEAARKSDSRVWVALNRRAYSSTRQALARLESVEGPRFIIVLDQQDQNAARDIYKEPPEVVENYMYANSIHLIDYLHLFGRGKITRVIPICPWTPNSPSMVVSKIEFSSGDVGIYEGVWNGPGPWAVTVVTPAERLEMRPLEQISFQLRGERKITQLAISLDDSEFKPGLRQQAVDVLSALEGKISPAPTLEEAFVSMRLVADIFNLHE
jgi:predicted dehydrogenase